MAIRDQLQNRRGTGKGNRSAQPKVIGSNRPVVLSDNDIASIASSGRVVVPARLIMSIVTGNGTARKHFAECCRLLALTTIQLSYGIPVVDPKRNEGKTGNDKQKPFQTVIQADDSVSYHEWQDTTEFDVHGSADALDTFKGDWVVTNWEYVTSARLPFRGMGSGTEKRVKPFRELRPTFERNADKAIVKAGRGNELRGTVRKIASVTPLVKRLFASPLYKRLRNVVKREEKRLPMSYGVDFFDSILPAKAKLSGIVRRFRVMLAKRIK